MNLSEHTTYVTEIIGNRAGISRRAKDALEIVARLYGLRETLHPDEIRAEYSEDARCLAEFIRNTLRTPIVTHKDGSYSARPDEIARFFNPLERPKQARRMRDLHEQRVDRAAARRAIRLAKKRQFKANPEYHLIAAKTLPSVRRGSSDIFPITPATQPEQE